MPSLSEKQLSRCLLCAMHCPIGAELDRLGRVRTIFPADLGAAQGACVLGLTAGRLLTAENRIFHAQVGERRTDADDALQALAGRLAAAAADRVAILVDVNRPLEGIAAAVALRDQALSGARLAAFIPPQDAPIASSGVGGCPPFAVIARCDLVLAVGDVCSSHPAVAMPLRDMQRAGRDNRLICVDTAPGRTVRAANESVLVSPARMAAFVCALAAAAGSQAIMDALGGIDSDEICRTAGLDAADVSRLAGAIKDAKSVGVLVSHTLGRYSAGTAVLAAAHELARLSGSKLWALPTSTGSAVLPSLSHSLGLEGMAPMLSAVEHGDIDLLIVVGFDPASVFPRRIWARWREHCETIAWAASLHSEFAVSADVLLPLAFAWEERGYIVAPEGGLQEFSGWIEPPAGVLRAEELMQCLGEKLGAGSLRAKRPATAGKLESLVSARAAEKIEVWLWVGPEVLSVCEPVQGEAWLVGAPEPHGYTGGLSVSRLSWQERIRSEERARLSPSVAVDAGLEAGGIVELAGEPPGRRSGAVASGEGGAQVSFPCSPAKAPATQPPWQGRVVSLPAHSDGLRECLAWRLDGGCSPEAQPAIVKVTGQTTSDD